MHIFFSLVFFLFGSLFAIETDFDVAIVGTSPVSMLEAICHIHQNERVLILESDERCGGAWKSIDICGIEGVDMGCHNLCSDLRFKAFLEKQFGCKFVCMEHPSEAAGGKHASCKGGFYFSGGCHELISNLENAIHSHENGFLLKQKLDSIYIDPEKGYVELSLGNDIYTTAKLIVTSSSNFHVRNPNFIYQEVTQRRYCHLYMLIEDPTPVRFTFHKGITPKMIRVMNLTAFLEMPREGLQLIVVQTQEMSDLEDVDQFLHVFKQHKLLGPNAAVIACEPYVYYQSKYNPHLLKQIGKGLVEVLDSSSYGAMISYLEKWQRAMNP